MDICCITERRLCVQDKALFSEIPEHGYDILSCPRKGLGGGVALIFNPFKLKPTKHKVSLYTSLEVFECLLRNVDRTYRLSVIHHSTQKVKYEETKIGAFMEHFESYLDSISDKSGIPVICGDFNFKVNLPSDKYAQNFINLYKSKGFTQHINKPTPIDGNTLDLVLTSKSVSCLANVSNIKIESQWRISDHFLVCFDVPATISMSIKTKMY